MAVDKTPLTILQEMMAKIGTYPVYELCPAELSTNPMIFTFKVTCDGLAAFGSGQSKKDAKHNAAKMMLEKLGKREVVADTSSAAVSPSAMFLSETAPVDNAIQDLQKLCGKLHLEEPSYKELEITGPPHVRVYTIQCTVSNFKKEGSAKSKKQAKHNAAKMMIQQLKNNFNVDCSSDENGSKRIRKRNPATNDYANTSSLSQISAMNDAGKLTINYHLKLQSERKELKNSLGSTSFTLLLSLEHLTSLVKECQYNTCEENITILKQKFQNTLDSAKIDFHHMLLQTNEPATFMLIIQLNIVPDVIEMSIGKTREETEWRTINKIVGTLKELLK